MDEPVHAPEAVGDVAQDGLSLCAVGHIGCDGEDAIFARLFLHLVRQRFNAKDAAAGHGHDPCPFGLGEPPGGPVADAAGGARDQDQAPRKRPIRAECSHKLRFLWFDCRQNRGQS